MNKPKNEIQTTWKIKETSKMPKTDNISQMRYKKNS